MLNATRKWLVLGVLTVGCGGSQAAAPAATTANEAKPGALAPSGPVSKRGSGSVAAHVGAGGGSLELDEGPRVEIPAGAVADAQDFVLKVAQKTTAFFNKESERPLGPTFSFAPALDAPSGSSIKVSFPLASLPEGWGDPAIAYEVSEGEVVGAEDSTRTKWQYERAQLSGGRVVASLPNVLGLRMQFVLTNLEAQ
ncbi:MAG TPA: hypothetical protein VJV78_48935 [Polyangiales bacterium]|nr:hypothetical protein [Polyangiales bacterium]